MIVKELAELLNLKLLAGENGINNKITGFYICDLMSWVMSRANKGNVWITVHTHLNILAVSSLLEFSCIIIPEEIEIDSNIIQKANEEGIPILTSKCTSFELAKQIGSLGI